MHILPKDKLKIFGYIGLVASMVVGVGEFLIHFSGTGYSDVENFNWLIRSDYTRVVTGHYLMLGGLPLYILGYYHFYLVFRNTNRSLAQLIVILGVCAFSLGGVWAGSRAILTEIVKSENLELLSYYKAHYEVLVTILRLLILFISILWVMLIGFRKSPYPKWMAVFSPIVILGLVFLSYLATPQIGKYLVPTAMNVTHFILFSLSLMTIKKNTV